MEEWAEKMENYNQENFDKKKDETVSKKKKIGGRKLPEKETGVTSEKRSTRSAN